MDEDNSAPLSLTNTILAVFFWGALFYACERLICIHFSPEVKYNTTSSAWIDFVRPFLFQLKTHGKLDDTQQVLLQQKDRIQKEDVFLFLQ